MGAVCLFGNFATAVFKHKYNKSHSRIHTVFGLLEILGTAVIINSYGNLIDSRERMKHNKAFFLQASFFLVKHINALLALILLFGFKALLLNTSHIENVKRRNCFFKT